MLKYCNRNFMLNTAHAYTTVFLFIAIKDKSCYEDYSKSSVMNGFPYARTMYARLILCINILHYFIHAHVKFRRNRANVNIVIGI